MNQLTTWEELLTESLARHGDSWSKMTGTTLTAQQLHQEFERRFTQRPIAPFFLWTKDRLYFSVNFEGQLSVESLPLRPGAEPAFFVGEHL